MSSNGEPSLERHRMLLGSQRLTQEGLFLLRQELRQWQDAVVQLLALRQFQDCPSETTNVDCYEGEHLAAVQRVRSAVCQVLYRHDSDLLVPIGTGVFVLAPNVVLTAAHLMAGRGECSELTLRFDFETTCLGQPVPSTDFAVDSCFTIAPEGLDFAVLMAARNDAQQEIGQAYQPAVIGDSGVLQEGEPVLCVQHPLAQRKQLSIGTFARRRNSYVLYDLATDWQSSGAPIINRTGEVVAIHHGPEGSMECLKIGVGTEAIRSRLP